MNYGTDQSTSSPVTVRQALYEALREEMTADADVILMGEEVGEYQGAYKISKGLLEEFGANRVMDTPISEYGFAGIAVGASYRGLKPVVEFMSFNFSMQAIDHILNSAAKTLYMSGGLVKSSIVFRGPNGAAAGVAAQHSQCYASWYAHCPGLKVVAPYDAAAAKGLLKASIRDPNPVVFLEHELLYGRAFPIDPTQTWSLGKAKIRRQGEHITFVSFSLMIDLCLKAAEILETLGIDVEVIDLCTLRPLDKETILNSVRKTHRVIIVEEGWPVCGISSEIISIVTEEAFDELDAPPRRICGKDVPLPYAQNLEAMCFPQIEEIVSCATELCQGLKLNKRK